ncbi:E3 ubiquitin-protein ligase UPL3-like isoform X2 [Phragmites australis]|uniref:E3 ubiquitin-protein ligase UPL3-like isoform X2 n=1 Tax=Phragmites australis TaxID=29695 RepID=UPI002D77C0D3|nr:E3 ubiquitin-protein ligase UPL3-like isoform X2 [Phragmites australis]
METRSSRKRAAAAAAASPASKRSRPNTRRSSSSAPAPAPAPVMDPSPSSRRRSRSAAADKGKDPDPTSDPSPPAAAADDDDAAAAFPQSFTSASSALQGLLRRLGAGLDDLLPSSAPSSSSSASTSAHLKRILAGLQADGDESRQLQSLMQLCEMLSIGTEDSLAAFPVDAFVPILVGMLGRQEEEPAASPEVMLLAARALANLVDVLPSSCSAVVHYGAIQCFCARLLTIEYMDLAEQSLQALKKISLEHPTACLRAGALMAVLSYLDFFSTGVQRVALSTAANICRKLPSDASEFVMEAVPLLTNLLNHHDSKVLEHASVCLTRIAEAFASYPEKLDELCSHGLVAQAASLIAVGNSSGQAPLSTSTYTGLIRLLSICASGSLLAVKTLLLHGISSTLKDILSGSGLIAGTSVSPALTRPADQMFEIVSLADDLLPYMPARIINLPTYYHAYKGSSTKKSASIKQDGAGSTENERSGRESLLREHPELLQQFGMDLLPTMTQVYGSSVNAPIRHKCLSIIGKLMYYSSAETIQSFLGTTNISSFLAGILAWKDPQVLIPGLQIAEIMMEKLPETFSKLFVREGVVHAVESLICSEPLNTLPSHVAPHDKDSDPVMSSRSRRQRRRGGAVLTENSSLDESNSSNPGTTCSAIRTSEVPNTSLRFTVSDRAKSFKNRYFPMDPDSGDIGVTDDLLKLRALCAKLNSATENVKIKSKGKSKALSAYRFDISDDVEEQLDTIISEMLAELSKVNGVSTFEFIRGGVVTALLDYLSCGTFGKERVSEENLPKLRQQALRRYKSFISIALSIDHGRVETPMALLVQKLQSALSSLERFPVVLSQSSRIGIGGSRLTSGLSALAQPFKLRLARAQGETSLRDYASNIVLIDSFASLAAVEEFLWPRVQRSEVASKPIVPSGNNSESGLPGTTAGASLTAASAQSGRRPTTRSKSSAASSGTSKKDSQEESTSTAKGKGKAVVKPNSDEQKGPNTRNAARQKSASEKELEMKRAHGHSSSEDEELDTSPVEIDDALMIDDDDDDISDDEDDHEVLQDASLPICSQDGVHDVKLGDADDFGSASFSLAQTSSGSIARNTSSRGAGSAEFQSGNTFGSRGAMSFVAATMAGLASVGGRSVRGGRDRRGLSVGGSMNEHNKLIFTAGGKQLSKHLTVYQAIQRQLMLDEDDEERFNGSDLPNDGNRFWGDVFTITYQKADSQAEKGSQGGSTSLNSKSDSCRSVSEVQGVSLLDSILQGELPCDLERTNSTYNILALLRVLEGLNQLSPRLRVQGVCDDFAEGKIATLDEFYKTGAKVPSEEFVNSKLTPKVARQMQDVLALCSGSLPSWCYQMTKACPFLFPFETRRQYFYSTAFGLPRALNRLQQQQGDNHSSGGEREVRFGRLQRQKVRVSRNRILDSAAKVMEMFSSQRAVLEVEYFGEVGTGLGPTLEFYTLLSHELQSGRLGLWRSSSPYDSGMQLDMNDVINVDPEDGSSGKELNSELPGDGRHLIQAPLGLFPRPWPPKIDASEGSRFFKVLEYFRLIGRVMAKVLQDGRLLDLPLSTAFYKLILGQELDLFDIVSFDAEFGKTLQELQVLVERKRFLESTSGENPLEVANLRFRGTAIEDLCLDFTLPGYSDYVLKEGEGSTIVNIYNLEEYIALVVDATVKSGVMRQAEAFRSGFNQVFDISALQIFSPQELDYLICGRQEIWEPESLVDNIKFDHGYTAKSPAIVNLLEIMAEFTPEQQHAFCQFVTGAPRLPPGGLAALSPKLTIVRKHPSSAVNTSNSTGATESADDDLPSVMTCANYLKLPPYSTKEIMRKKLLYAILEGRGSFDLS